jgi:hypothetical protein
MRFQVPIVYDACNDYVELVVCSMTMRLTLIVAAVIIIPIGADKFTSFALAQGPPPAQTPTSSAQVGEGKRDGPPSLTVAGSNFVSLEGRFSVSLPAQGHTFRGLALPTPYGRAKGDAYEWRMKEASFVIGYADAAQSVDSPEAAKQVFELLREDFKKIASANRGLVWKEKEIALGSHQGIEQRLDLFSGFMVQRTYLVSHRLYQTVMVVSTAQREYESMAAKVLDSFKLLDESEVSSRLAEDAARAEPPPLPQQPIAQRVGSDASDNGLHGRVKTVLEESQDLSGTWSVQTKKRDSFESYNELGNLTRGEFYDYKGNLHDITVYGYIDGNRVSQSKTIEREYNPPPVMSPPGAVTKKSDPRYQTRFEFKYDQQKRLIEHGWFHSNGELFLRYVYRFTGNQLERLVYSDDGSLNQRSVSLLDGKGNEIERTSFDPRDGASGAKHSYVYEFDAHGNWTKRTTSKAMTNGQHEPLYVDFRTITYFAP